MIHKSLCRILLPFAIAATMLLIPCFAVADMLYVVNSQSRTLSSINTATDEINNSFAALGNIPNKIVVDGDYLWSVNSGDNAVQKISRLSGATMDNFFVGPGANPWDAVKYQNDIFVSGLFTGKVYRIDTSTGNVTGSVTVGTAPEALLVFGDKLYVSNAGNYSQNYVGSSVSVIDIASFSVTHTIPVEANPQYLAVHNGRLHVSCTGNWAEIGGAICIINPATNAVEETIEMGGTPGRMWMANDDLAYVGDSMGMRLFSYNPSTYELLHGSANPIAIGCSEIVGTDSFIAVLQPTWSGNGTVRLLYPDLSSWKQYTVAMMPTDMKLWRDASGNEDPLGAVNAVSVYPNPAIQGAKLVFSSLHAMQGRLSIYNLKGQQVASHTVSGTELSLPDLALASGVYFYRMQSTSDKHSIQTGKFMVLK